MMRRRRLEGHSRRRTAFPCKCGWSGFAVSGGVAQAVVHAVKRIDPDREVKVVNAEGLQNCKKNAPDGKAWQVQWLSSGRNGTAGRLCSWSRYDSDHQKASAALDKMKKEAAFEEASDSKYQSRLESLEKLDLE